MPFPKIKISRARITNWIILFIIIYNMFNIHYWTTKDRVINFDIISYYAYLPATFIYKDISLKFIDDKPGEYRGKFWPNTTDEGNYVIKTSMGLSFLYSPFFFLGHIAAKVLDFEANGFTVPYKFFLVMGTLVYFAIGLCFLRKVLERFFNQKVVIFSLISIVLGTNLYYYVAIDSTMPHAYNFTLFSIFIFLTIVWHQTPNVKNSILIGILLGLISLIRPTNIIIILVFLLWNVKSGNDLKERLNLLLQRPALPILIVLGTFMVWIPQLIYWKAQTGHFLYFSYQGERFFFSEPYFWKGLFSYRSGWLFYTPIMLFAIAGIFVSFKHFRKISVPITIFSILNIYIIVSWWCWWYGGSFGNRAFIDSYAILAIPLAVFLSWIFNQKKIFKLIVNTVLILLILLNLFQTWQYYGGDIHHDSMTKKAYWKIFLRPYPNDDYKEYIVHPDYEKAKLGQRD